MIPESAVEAALEVFWVKAGEPYPVAMRAALEAAAPFIAAAAFERGYVAALDEAAK